LELLLLAAELEVAAAAAARWDTFLGGGISSISAFRFLRGIENTAAGAEDDEDDSSPTAAVDAITSDLLLLLVLKRSGPSKDLILTIKGISDFISQ
jgi:hypothetical protein